MRRMQASEVAREIRALTGEEHIAYTVASPDMWQRRGAVLKSEGGFEGESIAELFARAGVPLTPADNARVAGWQRVREYLAPADDGKPLWQAFPDCANLLRTLPLLMFDSHNREDAADGEDHAPEALRYGLMSRPHGSKREAAPARRRYDPFSVPKQRAGFLET